LVAGIWAAAATAVALIALLDDDSSGADRPDGDAARIARLNRTLDARIDSLEKQLDGLASSDEVTRLGRRVEQAEEQARSAARAAREASQGRSELEDRIQELEDRVEQLESQPASPDEQP
jgi:predicted  nucleic acid-binding Zn-ribbon protein